MAIIITYHEVENLQMTCDSNYDSLVVFWGNIIVFVSQKK